MNSKPITWCILVQNVNTKMLTTIVFGEDSVAALADAYRVTVPLLQQWKSFSTASSTEYTTTLATVIAVERADPAQRWNHQSTRASESFH